MKVIFITVVDNIYGNVVTRVVGKYKKGRYETVNQDIICSLSYTLGEIYGYDTPYFTAETITELCESFSDIDFQEYLSGFDTISDDIIYEVNLDENDGNAIKDISVILNMTTDEIISKGAFVSSIKLQPVVKDYYNALSKIFTSENVKEMKSNDKKEPEVDNAVITILKSMKYKKVRVVPEEKYNPKPNVIGDEGDCYIVTSFALADIVKSYCIYKDIDNIPGRLTVIRILRENGLLKENKDRPSWCYNRRGIRCKVLKIYKKRINELMEGKNIWIDL